MSDVVVCSQCIAVCECVMWLWACDLRCMHILGGWHPRWLLHSKQDFSGRGRLRKTAYELTADQRLKARGGCYNWPTPLSTFSRAPLPLGPRLLDLGIVSSALFPSSDLPPSRLRINKALEAEKRTLWERWVRQRGEINMANGGLWGTRWKSSALICYFCFHVWFFLTIASRCCNGVSDGLFTVELSTQWHMTAVNTL